MQFQVIKNKKKTKKKGEEEEVVLYIKFQVHQQYYLYNIKEIKEKKKYIIIMIHGEEGISFHQITTRTPELHNML